MIAGILFYYLCISIGNPSTLTKFLWDLLPFRHSGYPIFLVFFFDSAALTGDATYTASNNSSYIISLVQSLTHRGKLLGTTIS